MSFTTQVGAIDPLRPIAVKNQPKADKLTAEKIQAIKAEQIDVICRQMIKPVFNRLGRTTITEAAFIEDALPSVKQVVEHSFSIPLEYMKNGLSLKLFAFEPVGFLAEIVTKNKIKLDPPPFPRGYRISLDFDNESTLQRGKLTFVRKEVVGETTLSQKAVTIEELEQMGT
jgi:hypothetical protein